MSDELKLEPEWVAKKQAIQEAARQPPPRRRGPILGAVIGVVLVALAALGIALYAGGEPGSDGGTEAERGLVKVEVRATPVATIKFRGRDLGRTPITLHIPRSTEPVAVEATFTEHKMNLATRQSITQKKKVTKTFVPDDDQSVDFDVSEAN